MPNYPGSPPYKPDGDRWQKFFLSGAKRRAAFHQKTCQEKEEEREKERERRAKEREIRRESRRLESQQFFARMLSQRADQKEERRRLLLSKWGGPCPICRRESARSRSDDPLLYQHLEMLHIEHHLFGPSTYHSSLSGYNELCSPDA